mmetsp:Transcript_72098/g.190117  ORF Transcript_72098/g.190117 Transcript_72098/m.190117 type:complete len:250 (+) Transcript_72098:187-936(+)
MPRTSPNMSLQASKPQNHVHFDSSQRPVNFGTTECRKLRIALGKSTASLPLLPAQRARVRRLDHLMPRGIDNLALFLREATPKQEHDVLATRIQDFYHLIGELLPAALGVRVCLVMTLPDRQAGVEQQNSLLSPREQVPMARSLEAWNVDHQLLVHVLQARRRFHARHHAEAHAMGLAWLMVRILAQDHDLHAAQRGLVEGREHQVRRRMHRMSHALLCNEGGDVGEVPLLKLGLQGLFPLRVLKARYQ